MLSELPLAVTSLSFATEAGLEPWHADPLAAVSGRRALGQLGKRVTPEGWASTRVQAEVPEGRGAGAGGTTQRGPEDREPTLPRGQAFQRTKQLQRRDVNCLRQQCCSLIPVPPCPGRGQSYRPQATVGAEQGAPRRRGEREHPGRAGKGTHGHLFFFFLCFYYENKTNAPGEGSMITSTSKSTFYHFYSVVLRPALQ